MGNWSLWPLFIARRSNVDWATIALDEIGFGGTVVEVPEGLSHCQGRVKLSGRTFAADKGWHRYDGRKACDAAGWVRISEQSDQ